MSRALDDKEQTEFLKAWDRMEERKQKKIKIIRKAHSDGKISLIEMEVAIWRVKREHI